MSRVQLDNLVTLLGAGERRRPDAPLDEVRASFEKLGRLFRAPEGVTVEEREVAGVSCERVTSEGAPAAAGEIVYLHGGGYVSGSLDTHRGLVARLALASSLPVLSVGYRLAPEHPFPAAFEDSLRVVRARVERADAEGRRLALVGDSAGGGLVLSVLAAARRRGEAMPSAGVCLSPWTDLAATGDSVRANAASDPLVSLDGLRRMAELYLDGADPRDPAASPLHADLSGLPPILVMVGSTEALLDDATRVAARLEQSGVAVTLEVWDRMIHVWPLYARLLEEGQRAIERVAEFVRAALEISEAPAATRVRSGAPPGAGGR